MTYARVRRARHRQTGDEIAVLIADGRITTGLTIMTALENAGYVVIGSPQSMKYRREDCPRHPWQRVLRGQAFVIDGGRVTRTIAGQTFTNTYQLMGQS